jgi:UTP--glucose-1-phosphate uridylyltransferase
VEEAVAAGVDDILVITGRGKRAIEDHFDRSAELEDLLERSGNTEKLRQVRMIPELANVFYVRQGRPRGLGHAILCGAQHTGDEPFYVMLGDVLVPKSDCLPKLKAVHEKYGTSVIAVEPVEQQYVSRYGVIGGDEVEPGIWKVTELVEKPPANEAPSNLAIFGRYLLTSEIMRILPHVEAGRGGEIQLTDALRKLLEQQDIYAVSMERAGYDTGNVLSWLEANVALALDTEEYGIQLRERLTRLLG